MSYLVKLLIILIISFAVTACDDASYNPRRHSYPEIPLPKHSYSEFKPNCPFQFEVPKYAKVAADTQPGSEPCWYNIEFTDYKATLYLSYKPASSFKSLREMTDDAHIFASKHYVKADDIVDSPYRIRRDLMGVYFNIEGSTASGLQFFATDSNKHYLRGALYFNNKPNPDSVAPVFQFLKEDINHMLSTIVWKN
ncbi:MAG: gliding motility lipoprotein GldD [Bacteroidota bacterium]|nr:gliding motility lipoprotein GldD [Bacteroidota bacterium]